MKALLILCLGLVMSCTSTLSQKPSEMQKNAEILVSESQGGSDQPGFIIIKDEQEFQKIIKRNPGLVESGSESAAQYPKFPKDKKVVLYNLGTFRSGNHTISEIRSISVKNNILYVEVPKYESGGMEIQMISSPWVVFTVPSSYQFNSVELKYSK